MKTPALFQPLTIKNVTLPNRIGVSPMCQYSCRDGVMNEWHLVHLGSRAVGGAALVIFEATAVSPEGRITPYDSGLWNDHQAEALKPITRFVKEHGSAAALQLAHAGRKASCAQPWEGGQPLPAAEGGWQPLGPSAVPYSAQRPTPKALDTQELQKLLQDFRHSAQRAQQADFDIVEIHAAHGYLLHSFLSPLSNRRTDSYGGSLENRMRFPLEVVETVREVWPAEKPLFVRISASDWVEGGWDLTQSLVFCEELKKRGVDLVDCSSGGLSPDQEITAGPGYQVNFAQHIKEYSLPTAAVGQITNAEQAETILRSGQADLILLARELLRDPYWPQHAARRLGAEARIPPQYQRAH